MNVCAECKHCQVIPENSFGFGCIPQQFICLHNESRNKVTGKPRSAETCRRYSESCGLSGSLFEPRQ